jgi:TRAP-type C4-dicarboxylate transport system substrate-binding protein
MFERGRILGKMETEAKWQLKDAGRRTRQAVKDAAARLQKERNEDWSNLNSKDLMQRLVEKKVISVKGDDLVDGPMAEAFGELWKDFLKKNTAQPCQSQQDINGEKVESKSTNDETATAN